jgi:hypothetical protein
MTLCCAVQSSAQDEWVLKNRNRRMEVSGDRGKAVWYMCWADIWIGRKKRRANRESEGNPSLDQAVVHL